MTALTTSEFKAKVLEADRPVLVDFHAEWCGPCRTQGPIVDALAAELGEGAFVAKVNVDDEPALAELFQVRSIPTLILFRDGKISRRFTGLTSKAALRAAVLAA